MSIHDFEKRKARHEAYNEGFDAGVKAALSSPEVQGLFLAIEKLQRFDPIQCLNNPPCSHGGGWNSMQRCEHEGRISVEALAKFKAAFGQGE